jgi:hypothetical protein
MRIFLGLVILCLSASTAWAHKPSDSYLTLRVAGGQLSGEWHLALRDLESPIGLDANDDGQITWQELRSKQAAINAYAISRLQIGTDTTAGRIHPTQLLVDYHSDGAYAVVRFDIDGLAISVSGLDVQYTALFDIDRLHRGLLRLECGGQTQLAVFSPDSPRHHFALTQVSRAKVVPVFVREGIWHIWTGYDHILFLLALILPAGLERRRWMGSPRSPEPHWRPQLSIVRIISDVLKTVSAFTLAHSITLSLATCGVVAPPSRLIESSIAASVIFAAMNNLRPLLVKPGWLIAFAFGLIHGFGFANALADLGLQHTRLVPALFGFNAGVEMGQMAIVSLCLPLVLLSRTRTFYSTRLMPAGSSLIALVAAAWFLQRAFNISCFPL